ncbi:MAG: aminotransferase class V-fold PLP-dependent enzyme [Bacteriovoracaceae bacterium]|nr:aminotransferase class V-fold PLP-dependent enzyme [Bacteriovoracaceae bacterium]
MKLTNRYYFDYNATSPLACSVKDWVASGGVFLGNPSAIHLSGRESAKLIHETCDFLFSIFGLKKTHDLFFHSGATEGSNTILTGFVDSMKKDDGALFLYSPTDHSCITETAPIMEGKGLQTEMYKINKNGEFDEVFFQGGYLDKFTGNSILNYTWVNNETGVVWDLKKASRIKEKTNAFIHVDATQAPFKVEDWRKLDCDIDAYSFSGHKFGSFTGVGFSFIKKGYKYNRFRGGTQNLHGIYSMKLAIEEKLLKVDISRTRKAKQYLESELSKLIHKKGEIVGAESSLRNSNTIMMIVYGKKANNLLPAFDMGGMDISSGSACSSGLSGPNRVLLGMGYSEADASCALRFSFEPELTQESANTYFERIKSVFVRIL